jgi:glyceraldehyde 3-phosphate dehydrogenase
VPVRTGSIVELTAVLECETTLDQVRNAFRHAASTAPLEGIMDVLEEEWALARIVGDPHVSLIDLPLLDLQDGDFLTAPAWYDNEMGYSTKLAETAAWLSGALHGRNGG